MTIAKTCFFSSRLFLAGPRRAISEADFTVEARYTTQTVDHAYLEPDSGVAFIHENGQLVIISGSQNIHAHRKTIAGAIGLVHRTGPDDPAAHGGRLRRAPGCLRRRSCRPGRLETEATGKTGFYPGGDLPGHHQAASLFTWILKSGPDEDGTFSGLEVDLLADGGAYKSFSNSVTTRGLVHATGPYRFRQAHLLGRAVYTNTAVRGAMRGFGVPQTIFALESAVDELALKMGIDPLELRLKNAFVPGDTTVCGQVLTDAFGYRECLETLRPHYRRALEEAQSQGNAEVKRGVGLAGIWFGPGRSAPDQSEAWAELLPDDRLQVWIGAADMGQGAETLFWQVAAETMGFPLERVQVCTTDTRFTPDGNFSAGSRQTYVSGRAVQMAVEELKKTMEANRGLRL